MESHLALEAHLGLQVVLSDLLCSFEAVHDRHVKVHDNYVEELIYGLLVSLQTVCRTKHAALWQAELGEEHGLQGHQSHDLVVHQQNLDIVILRFILSLLGTLVRM